jgi:hypothetical protein
VAATGWRASGPPSGSHDACSTNRSPRDATHDEAVRASCPVKGSAAHPMFDAMRHISRTSAMKRTLAPRRRRRMHDAQNVALRRDLTRNVVEGRQTPRRSSHRRRFLPAGGRRAYSLLRRAWRLVRAFWRPLRSSRLVGPSSQFKRVAPDLWWVPRLHVVFPATAAGANAIPIDITNKRFYKLLPLRSSSIVAAPPVSTLQCCRKDEQTNPCNGTVCCLRPAVDVRLPTGRREHRPSTVR